MICATTVSAVAQAIGNPPFRSYLPDEVKETSGLFFHNGKVWTHNDSGGLPILYALDTTNFEVVQRITLVNAKNKDWEDVCTDGETVFVGDMGNNKGSRDNLRIFTFPLSAIPAEGNAEIAVDTIKFRFGDQTSFEKRKQDTDFDCEAIFATDKYLYLFSKNWVTETTRLYRLNKTEKIQVAEVVTWFDSDGLVTGADYNKEKNVLALVGYRNKIWEPFLYLITDFNEEIYKAKGIRISLPNHIGCQTEGICFYDDLKCFISAEASPTSSTRIFTVDFERWIERTKP